LCCTSEGCEKSALSQERATGVEPATSSLGSFLDPCGARVRVYATLGVFLLNASRNPQAHRSLIWFTVWSSVVHAGIMAVQSMPAAHSGHRLGDVPALFLVAIVLGGLLVWSENGQAKPLAPSVTL